MKKHLIEEISRGIVLIVLICILSTSKLSAQEVIAGAGNHYEAGEIGISWTLGETVTETFKAADIKLTQGFHQPVITIVSVDEIFVPGYEITAFPNPTKSFVTIRIEAAELENLTYMLYDFNGKLIQHNLVESFETMVSLEELDPALYFIRIMKNNKIITSIKLIKN
ncbi:MAG: T9SS type A sorting domain-containing protein [Bacteroidales bacterium]